MIRQQNTNSINTQGINKYMDIVNTTADNYLAVIGLDPNTEEAKYKENVKSG